MNGGCGKLDGKIDAVFAEMDMPQHPGAALLVIDHDEIVYQKCYGLADLETRRPITTHDHPPDQSSERSRPSYPGNQVAEILFGD